jgi:hypothetical protein
VLALCAEFPKKRYRERCVLGDSRMQPLDFFRSRIYAMINLNDPLAVLATRRRRGPPMRSLLRS